MARVEEATPVCPLANEDQNINDGGKRMRVHHQSCNLLAHVLGDRNIAWCYSNVYSSTGQNHNQTTSERLVEKQELFCFRVDVLCLREKVRGCGFHLKVAT